MVCYNFEILMLIIIIISMYETKVFPDWCLIKYNTTYLVNIRGSTRSTQRKTTDEDLSSCIYLYSARYITTYSSRYWLQPLAVAHSAKRHRPPPNSSPSGHLGLPLFG